MPDWKDLSLAAPVAANLASLGWTSDHPRVREVAATTARGHNALVVAPPVPAWHGPALAGALSHLANRTSSPHLLAAPAESVAEWAALAGRLALGAGPAILAATTLGRALRALRAGPPDLLILAADLLPALLNHGDLKPATLGGVSLAWPERWADDDLLVGLMADLPRDAQRLVLSADRARAGELAERYAWKAAAGGPPDGVPQGAVRTLATSWRHRVAAVGELAELLDPDRLGVWTVDRALHGPLVDVLRATGAETALVSDTTEGLGGVIIAADLPDHTTLAALRAAGDVVLLVPPGAEEWVSRLASPRRPLQLDGAVSGAIEEVRRRRAAIAKAVEAGAVGEGALALAPLFERYEAPAVAAALYGLWTAGPVPTPTGPPPAAAVSARVWVGVGRRDDVTVGELMALLTREVGMDRAQVGRIDVREGFSLIEVPGTEAARVAESLAGRTLRKRRLSARVDRGEPPSRGPRPGGRRRDPS